MNFFNDVKFAIRSLSRTKGLAITVILTLALGIGANAAIFSLVRGVLLRPLVNREEDRLIFIRQSAMGIGTENANFSVPEIEDIRPALRTITKLGEFSSIGFTMVGLGEPREVTAGVVDGAYFDVVGLHPVIGRLLDAHDDGPNAAGAMVLTYRFWSTTLKSDPTVLGRVVRLGSRSATVVGVLEPSVPYPSETEIIANIVCSPHHLSATMVQGRVHRMTQLFGRLAPGATVEQARAELETVHGSMVKQHPEAYSQKADFRIHANLLREQITSKASTVLWVLLAASGLVFIIAVSNVANLILARSVRREGELTIRAALGASAAALRRTLLAESVLLCGAGALLGVIIARPAVAVLARYASRFSVRALDLTVDSSMLWVGAGLAVAASVLLAFVPRLPGTGASRGISSSGGVRITGSTNARLRAFAVVQIAASFVLLAGASMLLKTLIDLQRVQTGMDTRHVLAINVPVMSYQKKPEQVVDFYQDVIRDVSALPGVDRVAVGLLVPWRDLFGFNFTFSADGYQRGAGEDDQRSALRYISGGFFNALGVPLIAGRDFDDRDKKGSEKVVIISQSVAQRMFPNQDAINRHIFWTDPVMKFVDISTEPRRIVGVAADIDDQHVTPGQQLTIYQPFQQEGFFGGRLFVHAHGDPYALVTPITKLIRERSSDQPVEKAATLEDVRAEVLTPDRLNTFVFGGFAAVALLIAVVGVAGVLAFSVSARTREFGIRLAIGAKPMNLITQVVSQGAVMAGSGVVAGVVAGFALAKIAASYVQDVRMPGVLTVVASALVLLTAAVVASAMPARRAARVDVMDALRAD